MCHYLIEFWFTEHSIQAFRRHLKHSVISWRLEARCSTWEGSLQASSTAWVDFFKISKTLWKIVLGAVSLEEDKVVINWAGGRRDWGEGHWTDWLTNAPIPKLLYLLQRQEELDLSIPAPSLWNTCYELQCRVCSYYVWGTAGSAYVCLLTLPQK